jgi:hypothetical protein
MRTFDFMYTLRSRKTHSRWGCAEITCRGGRVWKNGTMKCFVVILSGVMLAGALAFGQAAATSALSAQVVTRYAELVRADCESGAQQKLLNELADTHNKRAAEARQASKTDQATWETEVAKQLQEKAAALATATAPVKKERAALEEVHKELSVSLLANTPADITSGYNSSEMAYLDKLEERARNADQEAAGFIESRRLYSQQIITNNVSEDINHLTLLMGQAQREVQLLQQEKANMELKKLEFQALRRLSPK